MSTPPGPEPAAVPVPEATPAATDSAVTAPIPTAEITPPPAIPEPTATAAPASAVVTESSTSTEPSTTKAAQDRKSDEEPQNELTKRFTTAEWSALKEFRAQLGDIFASAYPDNPKAKDISIKLWGVTLDPVNPSSDARISVVLMKFLRARHLNISAARDMLQSTLRWRESFNIESCLKEEFPEDIFGNTGHLYGKDKGGRPVVYNVYGGDQDLNAVFGDVQRFIRWRVALHERSVAQLDFETVDQTIQVHDYEGVSMSSRTANSKAAASEATNIFTNHYPELLYKKFFVNVPTLLNWIFWAFKPLLPAETLAKMSVVGTGSYAIGKALLPYIDAKNLPERYGGEAQAF